MVDKSKQLRLDYPNAKIINNRDSTNPNNNLIIVCEHATNELPEGYQWSENDQRYFKDEHWGSDKGALDVAKYLAKELKVILLHSLYSRLLVDVNREPGSEGLFRTGGDGKIVELNKNLSIDEEQKRLELYHFGFFEAMKDVSEIIDPHYIICVHSFTPLYEGQKRKLELGVLVPLNFLELAGVVCQEFKDKGYNCEVNKPYDATQMIVANDTLFRSDYPFKREGLTLEIRNDLIFDNPESLKKIQKDATEICQKLFLK